MSLNFLCLALSSLLLASQTSTTGNVTYAGNETGTHLSKPLENDEGFLYMVWQVNYSDQALICYGVLIKPTWTLAGFQCKDIVNDEDEVAVCLIHKDIDKLLQDILRKKVSPDRMKKVISVHYHPEYHDSEYELCLLELEAGFVHSVTPIPITQSLLENTVNCHIVGYNLGKDDENKTLAIMDDFAASPVSADTMECPHMLAEKVFCVVTAKEIDWCSMANIHCVCDGSLMGILQFQIHEGDNSKVSVNNEEPLENGEAQKYWMKVCKKVAYFGDVYDVRGWIESVTESKGAKPPTCLTLFVSLAFLYWILRQNTSV